MSPSEHREAFEAWMRSQDHERQFDEDPDKPDEYENWCVQVSWEAWQRAAQTKQRMKPEWLRAIGKAASALRFIAANYNYIVDGESQCASGVARLTELAKNELLSIAATLVEIEKDLLCQKMTNRNSVTPP